MAFPKVNPTTTEAWQLLQSHFSEMSTVKMQHLFASEIERTSNFTRSAAGVTIDFSRNRISSETFQLLLQLAEEVKLKDAIAAQFDGEAINETEDRAVLHTALRDFDAMKPEVKATLDQMKRFSEELISGAWKGYTGKQITDVVNIGIGGSDLGPAMVTEALSYYKNQLNVHYVSNVDGDHVMETLKKVDRTTTLFIIVSKTFTTQETLTNATTIRNWFLENATEKDIAKHFVAVSTNIEAVSSFGIASENTFPMWNWVGGRFSLWSAVGLSTCCAVGYDNFEALLKGANTVDNHFKTTDFSENLPVIMALLSIWYTNFYGSETEAVLPYSQYLSKLVDYIQQAVMESNGKRVDRNGNVVAYQTSTVVWGSTGTNAQHAFFQMLHQGTRLVPSDFICFRESLHGNKKHQDILKANCYAQVNALLEGTHGKTVENKYKDFPGNQPTTLIEIQKLTPKSLGSLLALYEHKLFVQGVIWNIFSYDQWGVALGKEMANDLLKTMS